MSSDLAGVTKFFASNPDELIALKRRVMNDILPRPRHIVDAIYCVGGTVDTQYQALHIGALYWQNRKDNARVYSVIDSIGILRGSTKHGYCGFDFCRDWLVGYGVEEKAIVPIDMLPQDHDQLNTYTEARAFLNYARLNGWKTIILCAPFFHQIRASP